MKRIAINGFGRIGRLLCRMLISSSEYDVVAINDLAPSKTLAHLLKYDSIHGFFDRSISSTDRSLIVDDNEIDVLNIPQLESINWSDYNIDIVFECSGQFKSKDELYELVTLIYPTAPLMKVSDLEKAIKFIGEYDFSMSVALYPYPIQRALFLENQSNTIQMLEKSNFMKRSQDLKDCYHDAGQFIVGKTNSWLTKKPVVDGKTLPITVPRIRVQDIDDEEDWNEAELKFSLINGDFEERNLI